MSSILKVSEIQDPTNGNTALTIDSVWYMSMARHVASGCSLELYKSNGDNTT